MFISICIVISMMMSCFYHDKMSYSVMQLCDMCSWLVLVDFQTTDAIFLIIPMDGKSSNHSINPSLSMQNSHCAVSASFVSESLLSVHVKHPRCRWEIKQFSEWQSICLCKFKIRKIIMPLSDNLSLLYKFLMHVNLKLGLLFSL